MNIHINTYLIESSKVFAQLMEFLREFETIFEKNEENEWGRKGRTFRAAVPLRVNLRKMRTRL
jgi:hypothetical protein